MTVRRWNEADARRVRKDRRRLHAEQGEKCYVCDHQVLAVDGVVAHDTPKPVSGGRNEGTDTRFLCRACNSAKGRKNILEFALGTINHPHDHVSRERLAWVIKNHRNPAYPEELVRRADSITLPC